MDNPNGVVAEVRVAGRFDSVIAGDSDIDFDWLTDILIVVSIYGATKRVAWWTRRKIFGKK
jgi:hypothetical protein